jgi:hypothetical protein
MGEIRPFAEEHVRAAADLNLRAVRGLKQPSGAGLQNCFREIFLHNPWLDPDISALVYLDQGEVAGFLGVVPRIMEFRGRPIRVAVTSQFMIDREKPRGNAALELMRRFFRGPQDMSFTDGAGEAAMMVWNAAGGRAARLYSLNWTRVFRPLGTARSVLDRGGLAWMKGVAGVVTSPADFLLSKMPLGMLRAPESSFTVRPATAAELLNCIQEIGWRETLKPVYAEPSFGWLMTQAARATVYGSLRMLTVHHSDGTRAGWLVYYVKPGGAAYVLQIGVRRRDQFSGILSALFRDAWDQGSSAIKGQAIPQYLTQLTEHHCVFRHPSPSVLIQSKDPELMNLVQSGDAALTRLDGECWMPFGSNR